MVQLYNSRKTVLKKTRESEMWSEIDYKYMTEESEGEDDTIKQHKLPWRSRSKFYNRHYICFLSVVVLLFSCRTGQNCTSAGQETSKEIERRKLQVQKACFIICISGGSSRRCSSVGCVSWASCYTPSGRFCIGGT